MIKIRVKIISLKLPVKKRKNVWITGFHNYKNLILAIIKIHFLKEQNIFLNNKIVLIFEITKNSH